MTSSNDCAACGGALVPGTDHPPCLCDLVPYEPESAGGGGHARALRCPHCGSWLEQGARRCAYCSIQLASVRCWRCFELAFSGSSHCARCGAKLGLEGHLGPTRERCPSCKIALELVEVGDHRVAECMGCGGVFVDPDTLESLTRQSAMQAGVSVTGARRAALLEADVRYRPCPSCGALMMRRNFAGRSGVLVDVCRPHGVWFDANELTAVLMFVASGGLREVERAAAEEAKRELAERRAAALALQAKAACTGESLMIDSAAALLGAIVELFRARSR